MFDGSDFDETGLVGEDDRLHAVAQVELLEDASDVGLHGSVADDELGGDLGVGEAARDQGEDLELAAGELLEAGGRLGCGCGADELLDQSLGDAGGDQGVAGGDDAHGRDELLGRYVFGAHAKDGTWPARPGELGEEKPLGEGQVGIDRYVAKLKAIGYTGAITIEREISGPQQIDDIRRAIRLLESLR